MSFPVEAQGVIGKFSTSVATFSAITVGAAVSGKRLRLLSYHVSAKAAGSFLFSGYVPRQTVAANSVVDAPYNPCGHGQDGTAGSALTFQAGTTSGTVYGVYQVLD